MLSVNQPQQAWYDAAFGQLYPLLYSHRDDRSATREATGVARLLGLRPDPAIAILDACCGTARHVAPLARMGFGVWGVDRSPALLERALERPGLRNRLARADIRALPFGPRFDVVLNLFTSFGYFDDAENELALREMARVLRPGGRLVIDHMNRAAVERRLVRGDRRVVAGIDVRQRRWIDGDRVRKAVEIAWPNGELSEVVENVRLYSPEEMRLLLQWAGLTDIHFHGSLDGARFEPSSERMVVVARKP